ncbi:transferrin-binding protein-like solute binding protein [Neisseria meningitidis]
MRNQAEASSGHTDFGMTSEFEVDFSDKTIKGTLYRNNRITQNNSENKQIKTTRYTIQATLHGNRFKGKALAADKGATNGSHPFISDSDSLEAILRAERRGISKFRIEQRQQSCSGVWCEAERKSRRMGKVTRQGDCNGNRAAGLVCIP